MMGPAMTETYDDDIVLWSERQAELLRHHAAAARVNDAIDWPNIIEEIESVGNEQRFAVESNSVQALLYMLRAEAWPLSRDVAHWQAEARGFRDNATSRSTPSMRQRIDLAKLYKRALRRMPETIYDQQPLPVPAACPVTLDELLAED
jgi:hypothetical protein